MQVAAVEVGKSREFALEREGEAAAKIDRWLSSPGLQDPK